MENRKIKPGEIENSCHVVNDYVLRNNTTDLVYISKSNGIAYILEINEDDILPEERLFILKPMIAKHDRHLGHSYFYEQGEEGFEGPDDEEHFPKDSLCKHVINVETSEVTNDTIGEVKGVYMDICVKHRDLENLVKEEFIVIEIRK